MLLPFKAEAKCPKCWTCAIKTKHYVNDHSGCHHWRELQTLVSLNVVYAVSSNFDGGKFNERYEALKKELGFSEHLDRDCQNCGFCWVEKVVENYRERITEI